MVRSESELAEMAYPDSRSEAETHFKNCNKLLKGEEGQKTCKSIWKLRGHYD